MWTFAKPAPPTPAESRWRPGGSGRAGRAGRRPAAVAAAGLLVLTLAACAGADEAGGAASPPEAAPSAAITLSEPAVGSETAAPQADAAVTGVDYAFEVGDIAAGDAVVLENASDVEAHEMVVMRVTDESTTMEDIEQALQQDGSEPPPDFLEQAGFAFAMPGETSEQTVTFAQPGRYLLVCFIPQNMPPDVVAQMMASTSSEAPEVPSELASELGPPHALAGMLSLVDVE